MIGLLGGCGTEDGSEDEEGGGRGEGDLCSIEDEEGRRGGGGKGSPGAIGEAPVVFQGHRIAFPNRSGMVTKTIDSVGNGVWHGSSQWVR